MTFWLAFLAVLVLAAVTQSLAVCLLWVPIVLIKIAREAHS